MAAQDDEFRRSLRRGPDTFRSGHLFWMRAGSTWLNRDKSRPFALATPCGEGMLGTLIYGSTPETEKSAGAACVAVSPIGEGVNRNGLRARSYFYPGTLLTLRHDRLPPYSGFLGKSLPELRGALRTSVGVGRGSCLDSDAPPGSCRGRIVVLNATFARAIRAAFAVVLTEPRYSAERNDQIIVPVFTTFTRQGDRDLVVCARSWFNALPAPVDHILLPIPLTQSVWHNTHIARETEHVVDDETLREIDRRLCAYFALAPVDPDGDTER